MAGYNGENPDPINLPISMGLDVCAKTGLTYAATPRFCAAILQDTIYKHSRVGNAEPKLFQYHDEAAHLTVLIHALMDADERRAVMDRRGLGAWKVVERAKTLTPNRQCWEAIMKWVHEDGMMVNYMLKIWDRIYNISDAISNIKKSMDSFMAQIKRGWHFQNIIQFFFNFLNSPEG